ncbi:hypothetical protein FOL47_004164 [Perkinsus chesapeaki]|uniref:Uncharacterized protein n=1 Tax=Perkinsus chesapeaki TaxID=330153 RepID=A0A7J6M3Z2_PERCH|nr:hypothetical protein FOL47_004164 [Perkinsus chesapeaki]
MLLSFLLWLSIGGLYDLPLISYALSSTNDHTYAKPQLGRSLGNSLPIGQYEDKKGGGVKLIIRENNKVEQKDGYTCYKDPSTEDQYMSYTTRKSLGISKTVPFSPSSILICHSKDGRVWINHPRTANVDFKPSGEAKEPVSLLRKMQQKSSEGTVAARQNTPKKRKSDGHHELRKSPGDLGTRLGDREDLLHRAMREAGVIEGPSPPRDEESRTLPKVGRLSRGPETNIAKAPEPKNVPSTSGVIAAGYAVSDEDHPRPSTGRIGDEKGKDDETGQTTGHTGEVEHAFDGIEWSDPETNDMEDFLSHFKKGGILEDLAGENDDSGNRTTDSNHRVDAAAVDLESPPVLQPYTFDDLADAWDASYSGGIL